VSDIVSVQLERYHPSPSKKVVDTRLNPLKSNEAAALALEMIEHRSQTDEFLCASRLRAVVQLLSMCRRSKMLIEMLQLPKLLMAKVAFKELPVPSALRRECLHIAGTMVFEKLRGDDALGIATAKFTVDAISIHTSSIWARASLKVMGDTACAREASLAEWTFDFGSAMNTTVEMLYAFEQVPEWRC